MKKQLCPYCGRVNPVSATSFAENPWCKACLPDRLKKTEDELKKKYPHGFIYELRSGWFYRVPLGPDGKPLPKPSATERATFDGTVGIGGGL